MRRSAVGSPMSLSVRFGGKLCAYRRASWTEQDAYPDGQPRFGTR